MEVYAPRTADFGFLSGYLRAQEKALPGEDSIRRLAAARTLADVQHALAETLFAASVAEAVSLPDCVMRVESAAGEFVRALYALEGSEALALALYRAFFDALRVALSSRARRSRAEGERVFLCGFSARELSDEQLLQAARVNPRIIEAVGEARRARAQALETGFLAAEEEDARISEAFLETLGAACGKRAREAARCLDAGWRLVARWERGKTANEMVEQVPTVHRCDALEELARDLGRAQRAADALAFYERFRERILEAYGAVEPGAAYVFGYGLALADSVAFAKRQIFRIIRASSHRDGGELVA